MRIRKSAVGSRSDALARHADRYSDFPLPTSHPASNPASNQEAA